MLILIIITSITNVRVGLHVYPRTVVSESYQYKHPTRRVWLVQSGQIPL